MVLLNFKIYVEAPHIYDTKWNNPLSYWVEVAKLKLQTIGGGGKINIQVG